jgi:hypothetical protein
MATISRLSVSLTARTRQFKKGIASAGGVLKGFIGSIFSVKTAVIGLVGAAGLGLMAKNILDVNARVQTLKSSLKTVTGGTKQAAKAFKLIQKFASTTPFDLEQVVAAFIKLKALGMDPSEDALKSYGNTASAMGKSLNQMIEAVADASTGEFERLKEFGIKSKSEGDKVTFTFQKVATTVGKNATEIEGYLQSIGKTQFAGAMDDQQKNLSTAFSNLGDAFVELKTKIGESGVNDLVSAIANKITEFIKAITPESVKKFTTAIVNFGFFLGRVLLAAGVWVANFIADIGGIKGSWLKAQKAVVDFGLAAVGVFQQVSNTMQRLLGNTAEQQIARINSDIVELSETIQGRILSPMAGKKAFGLFGPLLIDPAKTAKMKDDLGLLKAEAIALKAGLTETPEGFLSKEIAATQQFLGGISSSLDSQIAQAERIKPKIKIQEEIAAFEAASEKQIVEWEKIFAGEEITKAIAQGRDPELQREILGQLSDMNGKMSPYSGGFVAVAQ